MPNTLLARLADLKADGRWSGTERDTDLRRYLARASSMAERLAGVPEGGLRRASRIEYPPSCPVDSAVLHLTARVIESVSQVVQLYRPGTDADFDAGASSGDGLLSEPDDYVIRSSLLATLERVYATWYRRYPRCLRVTYTAGYADPSRIDVALTAATWTEATLTLTQVGAFAGYSHTAGDVIVIESGTGVNAGAYAVAGKTSDDSITLTESLSTAGIDLNAGDITSLGTAGTDPPDDLQQGVIAQAMLLHNTADTAGLEKVDLGDAGGSYTTRGARVHPLLIEAARTYRRLV